MRYKLSIWDEFFQKHFNLVFGGIKSITKVVEGCMKVRI
jgi:hypothetical protein